MPRPRRPVPGAAAAPSAVNAAELLQSAIPNVAISTEDGPWTNMMSDEIDVDSMSMSMPVDNLGSQRKVAKTKRSGNYTHDEDIQLAISWEKISTDPITANEQPARSYWNRIADHFHANRTFESDRNACSLEHRWSTIQKECMKFQAYYEDVERRHPSGIPYQEHILEAQTLFAKPPENKKFMFLHCWLKVRHCQKFLEVETNKRPWSRSSTPSEDATEEEGNPISARPRIEKRPMGRKQAKERLKTGGDAGPYKEAIAELISDKKEEKKLREEEKKLKEERWKEDRKMKEERWNETKMMQPGADLGLGPLGPWP